MEIPKVLKEFRAAHGLEQEDLARLLETTQQTVSNWEKGTIPRTNALRRISHVLQNYRPGEELPPLPDKPTYHPDIRDVNWVPIRPSTGSARFVMDLDADRLLAAPPFFAFNEAGTQLPEKQVEAASATLGPNSRRAGSEQPEPERVFLEKTSQLTRTVHELDMRVEYHGMRLRADYLSLNVCAEFKRLSGFSPRVIEHGIFILDTLRRILEIEGKPRKFYALFVIDNDSLPRHHPQGMLFNRVFTAAQLHAVEIFVVRAPEEAAELLEKMEEDRLDYFDDHQGLREGF